MEIKEIFEKLDSVMYTDFNCVSEHRNPVLKNIATGNDDQKLGALLQYSVFPKNIISMLTQACYSLSFYNWNHVSEELIQNINEELGVGEGSISNHKKPHYTILRSVLREALDIDINLVSPNAATDRFVSEVKNILSVNNPIIVTGGVYALESSAIPELTIVKNIVLAILGNHKKEAPKLLLDFFDWHINEIEIGHRDRLLSMAQKEIKDDREWIDFEIGFRKVLTAMDAWWICLSSEEASKTEYNHEKVLYDH